MSIKVNEASNIVKNSFEKHNYSRTRKISAASSENRMEHILVRIYSVWAKHKDFKCESWWYTGLLVE
jgi:hypothetical protein